MKRKQMMISFGAYDDDVYDFLQNNKNASALVRMLVRAYMRDEKVSISAQSTTKIVEKSSEIEEKSVVNTEKNTRKINKTTSSDDVNRKKIQELDL